MEGLLIDWRSRILYWTDTETDHIEMRHLNGSLRKVIVSKGLDEPRAVVVDPRERYALW